ncbi:Coiled-coil domain-containing protein 96 [Tetrabaena socialis]|uniref:Coiled-coil domain-containing protein 96 n=1 Tax=Tetrabaena socialis TaxID=47790 RepID=A0A2J8A991_9CHLO|nr:Coiled-coil domain-containing protein 96 [Tetrabaena socialis]|eukprot:PNH09065.1 Coiled-coil domain-containing protein 96 [Tetrabaena socialis]
MPLGMPGMRGTYSCGAAGKRRSGVFRGAARGGRGRGAGLGGSGLGAGLGGSGLILTHVREKLQFIEKENSALDSGLGQLEAELADKRDRLGRAKVERDTLRLKGRKIKESGSNLTSPQLLDDIEIQKEKREGLMGSIEEAQRHYAELSDSIQRTNHRIMNATEELQAAQAAASIIAPGMAAAAAARSVSGAVGGRSISQRA